MARDTFFTDLQATPGLRPGHRKTYKRVIDTSKHNMNTSDVYPIFSIPADTIVHQVREEVVIAEGGTGTIDLGDAGDTNGWDNTVDLNAAVGTLVSSKPATDAYSLDEGKHYPSAGVIDVIPNNNLDTAIFNLYVDMETLKLDS